MVKIELCIETFAEAQLASEYKLDRVELCSALEVGGLTPGYGSIKQVSAIQDIETHVMIRPRPGDFVYSDQEIEIMIQDIQTAADLGASGVVLGVLNKANAPDLETLAQFVKQANDLDLEITFHRAFDLIDSPLDALRDLTKLGFDRILTSGQQPKAVEGLGLIQQLVQQADGSIEIMAGSGINADNVTEILESGVNAIHFTSQLPTGNVGTWKFGTYHAPDPLNLTSILEKAEKYRTK